MRKLLSTPYVLVGFIFYGLSAVSWMDVLSKLEFSKAFPLVSLSYVFSQLIGYALFHETISVWRAFGVVLIVAGVSLVARS